MNGLIMNLNLKLLKLNSTAQMMCRCMEIRNSWKGGGSLM
jgi:hypothetical protein